MKLSELGGMVGHEISVEIQDSSAPHLPTVHKQGELVHYSEAGLVVRIKGEVEIIDTDDLVDVQAAAPNRKIIRRTVRYIPAHQARQHLLDRHNIQWSLVKEMTPETAFRLHEKINHTDLGHRHRPEGEEGDDNES